jgi:hypothetical protein
MSPPSRSLLVVATTPRPGASYLDATLAALDQAGADGATMKRVLSDGPLTGACPWPARAYPGPSGSRAAFRRALELALEEAADLLVWCEDDVKTTRNALRRILGLGVPDTVAYLTYIDTRECATGTSAGLWSCPVTGTDGRGFFCTQCLAIPRRTLEFLGGVDLFAVKVKAKGRWQATPNNIDSVLSVVLERSPWPRFGIHIPCLVEHVGATSAAHPGETLHALRRATNFPGEDFDALSLAFDAQAIRDVSSGRP